MLRIKRHIVPLCLHAQFIVQFLSSFHHGSVFSSLHAILIRMISFNEFTFRLENLYESIEGSKTIMLFILNSEN